jgi:D-inositol-3-phosphate glycosyltransferase
VLHGRFGTDPPPLPPHSTPVPPDWRPNPEPGVYDGRRGEAKNANEAGPPSQTDQIGAQHRGEHVPHVSAEPQSEGASSMQIALVADHLCLPSRADAYPGDPARRVLSLARALAERDHAVTIYSRTESPGAADDASGGGGTRRGGRGTRLTIEHIQAGPQQRLAGEDLLPHIAAFAGHLADRWRLSPPDVVHAYLWTSGLAALAGTRGLGIPVVQTFHSLGSGTRHDDPAGAAARIRLEASIGRSVQAVLAGTSEEREDVSRLGVASPSVRIVPAGVDTTLFQPAGPTAERSRKPRILMVSPPGDQPELVTVLRALKDLPGAELVIAGGPPRSRLAGDPGGRALTALARRLGLAGRLTCTGKVRESDMPALMRSADVLVHLTTAWPFAVIPVEAMACGLPVIGSEAHADAVTHGNTGFLVPPAASADSALLARRIGDLLANPMLRDGYRIAAASRAASRYSWERIGQETEAVYEALLGPQVQAAA